MDKAGEIAKKLRDEVLHWGCDCYSPSICNECMDIAGVIRDELLALEADRDRWKARAEKAEKLQETVENHLSELGACVESEGDDSLCEFPGCTYCMLARAIDNNGPQNSKDGRDDGR